MKPNIWDKLDSIGSLEAKSSKLFEFLEKNKPIPADKFLSSAPSFSYRYLLGELVRDHSQNLLGHGEGWSLHKPIAGELADRVNGFLGGLGTAPRATKTFDEVFLALLTPLVQNREFLVVRKINSSLASFELGQLEFQREYMEGALSVAYILTVHPPLNNRERVLHLLNHKAFELRRASDFFLDLCKSVPNLNFIQDPAKSFFDSKRRLTATQAYPPQSNRDRVLIYSLKSAGSRDDFVDKAEALLEASPNYLALLEREYNLRLGEPLVNVYKLLSFPANRGLYLKWLDYSSVHPGQNNDFISAIRAFEEALPDVEKIQPPTKLEDLFTLFLSRELNATRKYAVISKITPNEEIPAKIKNAALKILKDREYRMERFFLGKLLKTLEEPVSANSLIQMLQNHQETLNKTVENYKERFDQWITPGFNLKNPGAKRIHEALKKSILAEKNLEAQFLWEIYVHGLIKDGSGDLFQVATYIANFYMTLRARVVNLTMIRYIGDLAEGREHFLKELATDRLLDKACQLLQEKQSDAKTMRAHLDSRLKVCQKERLYRDSVLQELVHNEDEKERIISGEYHFSVKRIGSDYVLEVHDADGKLQLRKEAQGVKSTLDFLAFCRDQRIRVLANLSARKIKILYHQANLELLDFYQEFYEVRQIVYFLHRGLTWESRDDLRKRLREEESLAERLRSHLDVEQELFDRLDIHLDALEEKLGDENHPFLKAGRVFFSKNSARLKNLYGLLEEFHKDDRDEELQRVKDWATREVESLPMEEVRDIAALTLEDLRRDFLSVSPENIEATFLSSRVKENNQFRKELFKLIRDYKDQMGYEDHANTLAGVFTALPIGDLYHTSFESLPEGSDPQKVFYGLQDSMKTIDRKTRMGKYKEMLIQCQREKRNREDYIRYCQKDVDLTASILLYNNEIEFQKEYLTDLSSFETLINLEIMKLQLDPV